MAIADTHVRIFGLPDLGQEPGVIVTASPAVVSGSAAVNVLAQTAGNAAVWLDTGIDSYIQMEWQTAPIGGFNAILVAYARFTGGVDLTSALRLRAEWDDEATFTSPVQWPTGGGWQPWVIEGSGTANRKQWLLYDGAVPAGELDRINAARLLHTFIEAPSFPDAETAKTFLRVHFSTSEASPPPTSERHIGWVAPCFAYFGDPGNVESSTLDTAYDGGIPDRETRGGVRIADFRTTSRGIELQMKQVHEADIAFGFVETFKRNAAARLGILAYPDEAWSFHRHNFGIYTFDGPPRISNWLEKTGHRVADVALSLRSTL